MSGHASDAEEIPNELAPLVVQRPVGSRFRLQGKRFFFTWPRCSVDAKDALAHVLAWRPCDQAMVAREKHADGTPHLHALIWLTKRCDLSSYASLDRILDCHGNYQAMKDPVACVQYLMKGDDFHSHGFEPREYVDAARKKRKQPASLHSAGTGLWSEAAEFIQGGGALADIENQGFVARNLRQLQAYDIFRRAATPVHRVGDWAKDFNVMVVWGDSGVGKSYWARESTGLPGGVFVLPVQSGGTVWWDGYAGERTILLDDFDPSSISMMNMLRLLDPYPYTGQVKGLKGGVTLDHLTVIITNNMDPVGWYSKCDISRQAAFARRLSHVKYVPTAMRMQFRQMSFDDLCAEIEWPIGPTDALNLIAQ